MGHSEAAPFPWLGSASLVVEMSKTLCVEFPIHMYSHRICAGGMDIYLASCT